MDNLYKNVSNKDLEFLLELDGRCFIETKDGKNKNTFFCSYPPNKKLTPKEMKRVLSISERLGLLFYPHNVGICYPFVGFEVFDPKTEKILLHLEEQQLPKDYDFQTLSRYFMKHSNLRLAKSLSVPIKDDKEYYLNALGHIIPSK